MPSERFEPDDPRQGINRARRNLIQARRTLPGVYLEDLCFHTQQAVEESLKALLLHQELSFPYTHDLSRLLGILEENGYQIPDFVRKAVVLSQYEVVTRYPGVAEAVGEDEYAEVIQHAELVVQWVEQAINVETDTTEPCPHL